MIVLERTSGLGDILCCIPAYRALKQKYPNHLVVFAAAKPYDRLLRCCGEIDAVYGATPGQPVPQRKAAWLVDRHVQPQTSDERGRDGQKLHLAHVFLSDCELPLSDWQPRFSIPRSNQEAVSRRLGFCPGEPIIALHSGRSWPVRELPEACWRGIVRELRQEFPARIIHFCSPARWGDKLLPVHTFPDTQPMPVDLSVMDTAAVLSQCRLLIGIDSGLLHLAGAVGTPTVGIFGAVNPAFRLPFGTPTRGVYAVLPCSFCHHEAPIKHWQTGCPNDVRCMKEISVDQVREAAWSLLLRDGDRVFQPKL